MKVIVQDLATHLLEGALDGNDLVHDVDTVRPLLDHPLHAAYMTLHALESAENIRSTRVLHGLISFPDSLLTPPRGEGIAERSMNRGIPVKRMGICFAMSIKSAIKTVVTLGKGIAGGLPAAAEDADPLELFQTWFEAATESGVMLPESMALSTATVDGAPSVRMVLLKGLDPDGFVFYTNYESRKAEELDANPRAGLCFHWPVLQRQVRVTGSVERVSQKENEAYFSTRPKGSQVGAWASKQSGPLPSREALEREARAVGERFADGEITVPPFWGGYRVRPDVIEFWQGRADRLHDRLVFRSTADGWETQRLYP